MRHLRRVAITTIAASLVLLAATPARADITAFLGVNTTPANRLVTGGALSVSILIVGFEGEYAVTRSDDQAGAPSLKTGMANAFLQNPIPIKGLQFYVTAGGGLYNEALGPSSTTGLATNVGAGAKIELVSHVKLRIDYRVFNLAGSPLQPTPKRLYAGLSLSL
jgi:opacity protein-like surface antigen